MASFTAIKGGWSITRNNNEDILREGEKIRNVREVFLLRFPVGEAIRPGATTFGNAFDADNHVHVYNEAMLQLTLKVVADMRVKYDELMQKSMISDACEGDPIVICLESVVGAEPDPMLVVDGLEDPANLHTRPFLTGIPDRYPIVEYRLFIFVRHASDSVNFGRIFAETIANTKRQYAVQFGSVKLGKRKKGDDAPDDDNGPGRKDDDDVDLCSYTGDANAATQYGLSLKETEKWKLIRSEKTWCNVADMILGFKHLTRPDMQAKITMKPLSFDGNPANPRYVLSPYLYFKYPHQYADHAQISVTGYDTNGTSDTTWTFPVANRVVRVSPDDQMISRFRGKLLPDYFVRNCDETSDKELLEPNRRFNAEYWANLGQNDALDREMVGDELDVDGDIVGEDANLRGAGLQVDENGNVMAGNNVVVAPERELGGVTTVRIKELLKSVLPQADELYEYDTRTLLREDFEDSTTLHAQRLLTITDDPDRSAFHMLRYRGAILKAKFATLVSEGGHEMHALRQQYLLHQQRQIRAYDDMCMVGALRSPASFYSLFCLILNN